MPEQQHQAGYVFGPRETRGVILGLRGGQLVALSVSVAVGFTALHALSGVWGPLAALAVLGAGAAATWMPIGHLTLEQWVPTTTGYLVRALAGGTRFRAREHRIGQHAGQPPREEQPWSLRDFRILSTSPEPAPTAEIGVVKNRRRSTYVGVLEVFSHSSALLGRGELDQRVGLWASVLAGTARHTSPIRRVQWLARSIPEDREALMRHLEDCKATGADDEAVESYRELLQLANSAAQRHESYLAVELDPRRAWRHIRIAGQGDVDRGASVLMAQQLRDVADWLRAAELGVGEPLSPRELAGCIRYAYDPTRRLLDGIRRSQGGPEGPDPRRAWPTSSKEQWASYRSGHWWHAVYYVEEWPRVEVSPDFLRPLLLSDSRHLRTVSMVLEPVPPLKASQEIRRARVADVTEEKMRDRVGQIASARREQEQKHVERTEGELAAGHAAVRFAGYVGVTATSAGDLEEACAEVERDAVASRLMLDRVFGDQEFAFTCLLPICRGLP
ncbi:MAG: hypothetical protein M3170_07905 [Candidatus Dormibacteraeota bacterium]|nr:hypothetical protein [Candidatus Dormibacteraeota bacterium]